MKKRSIKNCRIILLSFLITQLHTQTTLMEWNSWNIFQRNINEKLVKETVDELISTGMKDAGYIHIFLNDSWMAKERNRLGSLFRTQKNSHMFIKAIADYIHFKGLRFGLYNCAGTLTCAKYPGTRGDMDIMMQGIILPGSLTI